MGKLKNIHPGEVLMEEFLKPLEISRYQLSKDTGIPESRISNIIKGKRSITAGTALRLSKYFGNSAHFWLGLQNDFDLEEEKVNSSKVINSIRQYSISFDRNKAKRARKVSKKAPRIKRKTTL
jgi:addiction module HigA family antidote